MRTIPNTANAPSRPYRTCRGTGPYPSLFCRHNGGMTTRVEVKAELLAWARERAGLDRASLARRFKRLPEWERGTAAPTLNQLEQYASATRTAVGYLLLPEPPQEQVPIPDLRTLGNVAIDRPSPDLLDTIYLCQERQGWYRTYMQSNGESPLPFVGSFGAKSDVIQSANKIRHSLSFEIEDRGPTWTEALRRLASAAESTGVLVMASGVVGSNTHRKLDPDEFRGFALADDLAPVVFVNSADTKAAQIFTLAHEIAHVWLGESAVSDADAYAPPQNVTERWCNRVAAEFLVPLASIKDEARPGQNATHDEFERLARVFKVSTLVIVRRLHDIGVFQGDEYRRVYDAERKRILGILKDLRKNDGGNFYNTQPVRTSKRFAQAIIASTLEGQTLYRDTFRLLGFRKVEAFNELARRLGVM